MPLPSVLFVDDDLENMADHVRKLEEAGFAVTQRRTTDEALSEFFGGRALSYDAIVLDMMMPPPEEGELRQYHNEIHSLIDVWDGLRSGGHLLGILRAGRTCCDPPVLLLSNLDESEVLLEAWEQYVVWCAHLKQPVPSAMNESRVAELLRMNFLVTVRGKRKTPPWHLPEVVRQMISAAKPDR